MIHQFNVQLIIKFILEIKFLNKYKNNQIVYIYSEEDSEIKFITSIILVHVLYIYKIHCVFYISKLCWYSSHNSLRWLSFEDIVTKANENSVNEVLYGTMNIEDSGHMIYYYWS